MKHAMLKSMIAVVCVLSFRTATAQTDTIWEKLQRDKKGTPFSTMPTVPIEMVFITKDCSTYE